MYFAGGVRMTWQRNGSILANGMSKVYFLCPKGILGHNYPQCSIIFHKEFNDFTVCSK